MKKVIFLFLLFFTIKVNAEERTYIDQQYMDVYYNGVINDIFLSNRFVFKEHEEIPVYCLSFNIPISSVAGYGVYDLKNVDTYTQDQKKYLEIISYFGYEYGNHNDINYYLAAQDLIWSSLGNDVYWTYTRYGNDYLDLTPYKMDILNLYAEYINENQILTEYYSLEVGNSYFYEDYNTYLHQFDYYYSGPNEIGQNYYGITVNAYTKGQDSIMLTRMFDKGYESKLFMEDGYQTILKGGTLTSRNRILNFEVRNSSIKLIRVNGEELSNPILKNNNLKLQGAVYNVYDFNYNYLTSVTTDENGEATIYDLPLGVYRIREETPSYGFEPYTYYFDSSLYFGKAPGTETLNVVPIRKELNITNIYKIDNIEYLDSGIKFEIYRDNVLLMTLETDSNGKISKKLDYGKYTIKQLNSRDGFEVEPEFEFIINELENNLDYMFIKEKNTIVEEDIIDEITNEEIPEDTNIIEEETNNEENLEDTNIIEEEPINEDLTEITIIEEEIIEEKTTSLIFENTNQEIEINRLPRLFESKDIFDILCENLLLFYCY